MSDDLQNLGSTFWNLLKEPGQMDHRVSSPGPPSTQETPSAICFNENLVFWAMRNLPTNEAVKNLAIIGCVGSGKTTLIQLFLQSIAPRFLPGFSNAEQLIIFDGKCDVLPLLASVGLTPNADNFYVLNPYDKRCAVWDFAEDARTPLMARHLASLLVPVERHSNAPFFSESACDLVYAVILGLNASNMLKWTFRDLICALDSRERIKAVTAKSSRAAVIAKRILEDEKHSFGVLSSLGTKLVRFEPVAALWHSALNAPKFTIEKFLKRPGVLVIGYDPVLNDSLWPINALLLKALTQEILRRPNSAKPRHWFVLDEFPAMERVDCIHDLLRRGRSKGASVLLGTQGLESLNEIYQENVAEDILSQCTYKSFLRAGGPKTAGWAENYFGKVRHGEASLSESWSKDGYSYSLKHDVVERSMFLASVFMDLPIPGQGRPFFSINDAPCLGHTLISRRWSDQIFSWLRKPDPNCNVQAVEPRNSVEEQTLRDWSKEESEAFMGNQKVIADHPQPQVNSKLEPVILPVRAGRGKPQNQSSSNIYITPNIPTVP